MIGNKDAVAALDRELKGKIFRYVEPRDPVPQLPTMSIVANEFDHCETLVGLGEFEPGSFWKNVASHAIGGVFTGAGVDATWQYIMDRVGAHSMTNYIEIVKKKLNG